MALHWELRPIETRVQALYPTSTFHCLQSPQEEGLILSQATPPVKGSSWRETAP